MHRNRRLAIIGSEDGGDEVLVLLGDHNQPQEALDLALQTDAEFIGKIFISFAHQDGERQLYHLEEMRPYVGYCDAMPLETPDWRPIAKRNPVLREDGETVEWVGDVTFPVSYDRFDASDRQVLSSLASRMARLLEDHPFDPDVESYGIEGSLDIARDEQGRMRRLTFTLTLDLDYVSDVYE